MELLKQQLVANDRSRSLIFQTAPRMGIRLADLKELANGEVVSFERGDIEDLPDDNQAMLGAVQELCDVAQDDALNTDESVSSVWEIPIPRQIPTVTWNTVVVHITALGCYPFGNDLLKMSCSISSDSFYENKDLDQIVAEIMKDGKKYDTPMSAILHGTTEGIVRHYVNEYLNLFELVNSCMRELQSTSSLYLVPTIVDELRYLVTI
jgi:hypothetical protein